MRKVEFAEFLQDEIREEIPELENAQMWLRYIQKDNDRSYYGLNKCQTLGKWTLNLMIMIQ